MLVLVTYDVNTTDMEGRKRLRRIARHCVNYGQRVQNSVFECHLDAAQLMVFQSVLLDIIDPAKDSLRVYCLGNHYQSKVAHFGIKETYDINEALIV